jgi:hypothetical protein
MKIVCSGQLIRHPLGDIAGSTSSTWRVSDAWVMNYSTSRTTDGSTPATVPRVTTLQPPVRQVVRSETLRRLPPRNLTCSDPPVKRRMA